MRCIAEFILTVLQQHLGMTAAFASQDGDQKETAAHVYTKERRGSTTHHRIRCPRWKHITCSPQNTKPFTCRMWMALSPISITPDNVIRSRKVERRALRRVIPLRLPRCCALSSPILDRSLEQRMAFVSWNRRFGHGFGCFETE